MKLLNIFATSFYGSALWDLQSKDCDRLYKSRNVEVRIVLGVPPTTHRYLIEPMSGFLHAKTMLSSRYVKFKEMLSSSNKRMVNLLAMLAAEDNRTVMGKTMSKLRMELAGHELTSKEIKTNMKYFPVPEHEEWRLDFLEELLEADIKHVVVENMNDDDIKSMITILCTT